VQKSVSFIFTVRSILPCSRPCFFPTRLSFSPTRTPVPHVCTEIYRQNVTPGAVDPGSPWWTHDDALGTPWRRQLPRELRLLRSALLCCAATAVLRLAHVARPTAVRHLAHVARPYSARGACLRCPCATRASRPSTTGSSPAGVPTGPQRPEPTSPMGVGCICPVSTGSARSCPIGGRRKKEYNGKRAPFIIIY